ncbi:diguanylate cyclase domain-containing protein [Dyella nitratireducens]|uniref:Diguanylate cyclase response regulator n=1 Tax=Dyella nitratireducens TaxID=1849580 RepID=A0ABQ1FPF9_9GAMM|nr:diguanylate cyclase [Dyella nitratireducens]GGA25203.1 diguanylate cyclase response regulator [Dyella nitratireducens]GLQ43721.1 diguanylate cyclase response regulator [Dyella nitratireducens]
MNTHIPKILVVDDTHANLVAMRHLLADCGAELVEASSGNEALSRCLDQHFALILLDVNMPDMDGFEVASLLGETEQLRDTPVIFVTAAYSDDINRLKGYRSGAVDYIAKPINDVILTSKVRVFLELHNARMQLQDTLEQLSSRNQQLQAEIAERQRAEAKVRHQATHDMLTGLPNRMLFHERLRSAVQYSMLHGIPFALALVDIDGFKAVNDTYGHPAGDALLQAISSRLIGQVRADDTAARLGGDEFALIFQGADRVEPLLERCREICKVLAQPYPLQGEQGAFLAHVSASIGIALWNAKVDSDEALIQAADHALYQVKENGKNGCALAST